MRNLLQLFSDSFHISPQRRRAAKPSHTTGFTLIELLVVIAIIGILSSVVLTSLTGARAKGRDTRRVSDISQLRLALEMYYDSKQTYPTATSALATDGYISPVPIDPSTSAAYTYAVSPSGCNASATSCTNYVLMADLEVGNIVLQNDVDGNDAGTLNVNCEDAEYHYCVKSQ